ncbi:MAG: DUF423 domain-containing protein [Candidatus Marinimicrobia bacterium]|jgi:uncharacterized membrane protein YgdD (TMEM256/DUF423 family)|nr:DUF423 domain-containing protein [Candidatus Neomarinimicrobiota bacterium]MDP6612068.1 DUF423 domain-containing protein [Candidatus Neomarinimicrobiota bacterium]|tara:strand:- start:3119 stop:3484 length:366 start_codon:yes stop_codon:yes gene_type:complete
MKNWIILGASLAALAVILGAFGAHGLKSKVSPEDLAIFETGVRYHMYHALGLILIGILGFHYNADMIQLPAVLLSVGILVFSGSLYILVLTGLRWMGAITPIGGIALIAGWVMLIIKICSA